MKEKDKPTINVVASGSTIYGVSPVGLYLPRVFKKHLETNCFLDIRHATGTLTITQEELFAYLVENGGQKVLAQYDSDWTYLWDPSFMNISFSKKSNNITISGYLIEPALSKVFEHMETNFISKSKKDLIFSIVKSSTSLEMKNLGNGSSPLIKDNYNPQVITDLEFVIEAFKKTPPSGRICIMNGEPGTGKTHLVRSFLSEIDCVFLIVPSNLIASLDSPDFLPLLLRAKDNHEKPIILIIEDGDTALVPRKADNMSTITSLLNLSDGILGSLMDIKMIITTNALIKDMDQAIMRPGRLSKNIHVGPLAYDQANKVYQRLAASEDVSLDKRKFYTLAEVYDKFNNKDSTNHQIAKYNAIGFHAVPKSVPEIVLDKNNPADQKILQEVALWDELKK